ncbi:hypothetical protein S40288_09106 [Stachybotrys chartarum IBT 40288]|nr:hypothetical protein S40288_09106 [Stachybotrys chartarum IBT 40288]
MTKPWTEFRQEIVRLYIQEGRTLQDVREIMHQRHGFEASVRSYRQHFGLWRIGKYNCKKRTQRHLATADAILVPPRIGNPMLGPSSKMPRYNYPLPGFSEERHDYTSRRHSDDHYRVRKQEPSSPLRNHRLSLSALVSPTSNGDHYHPAGLSRYHRPEDAMRQDPWQSGHRPPAARSSHDTYMPSESGTTRDVEQDYTTYAHPLYDTRANQLTTHYCDTKPSSSSFGDISWTVPRSAAMHFSESETASVYGRYDGPDSDDCSDSSHSMSPPFQPALGLAVVPDVPSW